MLSTKNKPVRMFEPQPLTHQLINESFVNILFLEIMIIVDLIAASKYQLIFWEPNI